MDAEPVLKLLGGILGLATGITALVQYWRAQRWKRAEYVASEARQFFSDPHIAEALQMLDWGDVDVPLFPAGTSRKDTKKPQFQVADGKVFVTDAMVMAALMKHQQRPEGFDDVEVEIRGRFDALFDGLARFEAVAAIDLVEPADLRPFLEYWLKHIRGTEPDKWDRSRSYYDRIAEYLKAYGFDCVLTLCDRLDVRPDKSAVIAAVGSPPEARAENQASG